MGSVCLDHRGLGYCAAELVAADVDDKKDHSRHEGPRAILGWCREAVASRSMNLGTRLWCKGAGTERMAKRIEEASSAGHRKRWHLLQGSAAAEPQEANTDFLAMFQETGCSWAVGRVSPGVQASC